MASIADLFPAVRRTMGFLDTLSMDLVTLSLVYWVCLGVGLALVLFSALMGGLFDFDVDGGGPFTGPVIASWLTLFGGAGLITYEVLGMSAVASSLSSGVVSVAGAALFYFAFYKVVHGQEGGTSFDPQSALGREAEVITAIPADGPGEITFVDNSGRISGPARSVGHVEIANGDIVVIEKFVGGTWLVRPMGAAPAAPEQVEKEARLAERANPPSNTPGPN